MTIAHPMLTIDIVADIVCPWCFIGKRRLETATALIRREFPDLHLETRWRPFFLNPDTPPEGEPYLPFLERKFGGRAAVETIFERVRAGGRPYGVEFAFERITLRANTLLAHRLILWAQQRGNADTLVERLFSAQFQRGEYVADPATLMRIATECGYPANEWAEQLAKGDDIADVRNDEHRLRALGISMVPTFIVNHTRIVVGAEDPTVLVAAMREALAG